MSIDERLTKLGLILPEIPAPAGNYVHACRVGHQLYLSAKGSTRTKGRLGSQLTTEQGYAAAREVGLILLAVLRQELGSLDRVRRIVKIAGMVNADADFEHHPAVINGCSDLLMAVFGRNGAHARSAIGVASLPGRLAVAIDAVVEVD